MATANDDWGNTPYGESSATNADFAFDTSGYSSGDLGGSSVSKEGWYHFEVIDVVPELDTVSKKGAQKSPAVRFDLNVLHTAEGQSPAGTTHYHRVYVGGKGGVAAEEGAIKMGLRFFLGLYGKVEGAKNLAVVDEIEINGKPTLVDAETGKPVINMDTFKRAKGRQLVARIVYQPADAKKGFGEKWEIPFGRTFRPNDPNVADVMKDREALQLVGIDPAKCGKVTGQALQGGGSKSSNGNGAKNGNANAGAASKQNVTTAGPDLDDL